MKKQRQVAIVTDSTSSLTPAMARERAIHVVPIHVSFETQTYRDGIDLDADLFYRLLRDSERLPTTSQPTPADFVQTYSSLSEQAEAIVSIHISHKMSATLDSALSARWEPPHVPIHVIDSRSVSMGLGLIAIAAARAAAAGHGPPWRLAGPHPGQWHHAGLRDRPCRDPRRQDPHRARS